MDDLVSWLEAQIAEDERGALGVSEGPRKPEIWAVERSRYAREGSTRAWTVDCPFGANVVDGAHRDVAAHIARWDPARVLAECEAKRRRIAHLTDAIDTWRTCGLHDDSTREQAIDDLETALKLEALPYAKLGRPGYQESWRPA